MERVWLILFWLFNLLDAILTQPLLQIHGVESEFGPFHRLAIELFGIEGMWIIKILGGLLLSLLFLRKRLSLFVLKGVTFGLGTVFIWNLAVFLLTT